MAYKFQINLKPLMLQKSVEIGEVVTQQEVAKATNLSYPTIGRWYAGDVDRIEPETTGKLLAYFKCGLNDLIQVVEVPQEQ